MTTTKKINVSARSKTALDLIIMGNDPLLACQFKLDSFLKLH